MYRFRLTFLFFILFQIYVLPGSVPHPRAQNVPAALNANIKKSPEKFFNSLINNLVSGINSDDEKARIFHDWIALNIDYDVEGYFSNQTEATDEFEVLRTGRSVCQGYANIFKKMCDAVNIECIIISGYGRGLGFSVFGGSEKFNSNHAWNAVKLGGKWYLVDATWDAGYVDARSFIRRYGTGYFKLQPSKFIYTHFPEDEQYQFLSAPVSFEKFCSLPYLLDGFFEYGIEFDGNYNLVSKAQGTAEIRLKVPEEVSLMGSIYDRKGREAAQRVFVQKIGEKVKVICSFPEAEDYELILFANAGKGGEQYDGIMHLRFISSSGSQKGFPVVYSDMMQMKAAVIAPVFSPLRANSDTDFSIMAPSGLNLGIFAGDKFIQLEQKKDGVYSGKIKVPSGDIVLCLKDGTRLNFLCKWQSE